MTNNITDLFKSIQSTQALTKNFAASSQLSEIIKAKNSWKNSFSGLNMLSEITKSFNHHALKKKPYSSIIEAISKSVAAQNKFSIPSSAIEAISKSMAMQPKFSIPSSAFDAIKAISKQHEQLFGNFKFVTKALRANQATISQMNNLRFALTGISGQLSSTDLRADPVFHPAPGARSGACPARRRAAGADFAGCRPPHGRRRWRRLGARPAHLVALLAPCRAVGPCRRARPRVLPQILAETTELLHSAFEIDHSTLQPELFRPALYAIREPESPRANPRTGRKPAPVLVCGATYYI